MKLKAFESEIAWIDRSQLVSTPWAWIAGFGQTLRIIHYDMKEQEKNSAQSLLL